MRLFFPKQAHHRTKKMILVHVRLYVLLVVFYFDACNGVKISDQSQAHIETLIGMWLKDFVRSTTQTVLHTTTRFVGKSSLSLHKWPPNLG